MEWASSKLGSLITNNRSMVKPFYYLGLAVSVCWSYRLVKMAYKSLFEVRQLEYYIKRYSRNFDKSEGNGTVIVFSIDYNVSKVLEVIHQSMLRGLNVIVVLNEGALNMGNFRDDLELVSKKCNRFYRIASFSTSESIPEFLDQLKEEIEELEASMLIMLNSCYSGSLAFGSTKKTFSIEELDYIDRKVKLLPMIVTTFLKSNKDDLSKTNIVVKKIKTKENTGDRIIWDSYLHYLDGVKIELPDIKIGFFNN